MDQRLIEAGVHHERNQLHSVLLRRGDDARIDLPVIAPRLSNEKTCGDTIEICAACATKLRVLSSPLTEYHSASSFCAWARATS